MSDKRIQTLRSLIQKDPKDALSQYMLALELHKIREFEEAVRHLEAYLELKTDEGAAYRVLADSLVSLGRTDEARLALKHGIAASRAHHHEGMAEEFEERLSELS